MPLLLYSAIALFIVAVLLVIGHRVAPVWQTVLSGTPGIERETIVNFGPVTGMFWLGLLRGVTVGLVAGALALGCVLGISALLRAGLTPGLISMAGGALVGAFAGAVIGALGGVAWAATYRAKRGPLVLLGITVMTGALALAVVGAWVLGWIGWLVGLVAGGGLTWLFRARLLPD